jgi:hypothetical protein
VRLFNKFNWAWVGISCDFENVISRIQITKSIESITKSIES